MFAHKSEFLIQLFLSKQVHNLKLIPWSRVLRKPRGPQLVKNLPIFYKHLRFTTAFTTARRLFVS